MEQCEKRPVSPSLTTEETTFILYALATLNIVYLYFFALYLWQQYKRLSPSPLVVFLSGMLFLLALGKLF